MKFLESESSEYVSLSVGNKRNSEVSRKKKLAIICATIFASLLLIGALASNRAVTTPAFLLAKVKPDMDMAKLYYKLDHTATSTTEASALCASTGGQLGRVDTAKDVAGALKECKKVDACYIGLVRNPTSGVYIWEDGNPLVWSNWLKGQESTAHTPCVEMVGQGKDHGKWNGIPCSGETRSILCMRKTKRFYRVPGEVDSAAEYSVMCRSSGGEIAVILNRAENRRAWIACGSEGNGCWIGMGRDPVSYAFMWLDGTAVCFENWSANGPSGEGGSCAMIDTNGDWVDVQCSGRPTGVLCQTE